MTFKFIPYKFVGRTLPLSKEQSVALLDKAALAFCLAYIGLNPIRAKMIQRSKATNIRIRWQAKQLLRFAGMPRQIMQKGLPFELKSYLESVELTGRIMRKYKCCNIDNNQLPLLRRLNIPPEKCLNSLRNLHAYFTITSRLL